MSVGSDCRVPDPTDPAERVLSLWEIVALSARTTLKYEHTTWRENGTGALWDILHHAAMLVASVLDFLYSCLRVFAFVPIMVWRIGRAYRKLHQYPISPRAIERLWRETRLFKESAL